MAQNQIWVLIGLLSASIPLVALARRANIAYPIVLVFGGLLMGFIPGLPQLRLDPSLVLIIFLPPLLYWESVTAPTDVMRQNWSQIWTLALGLVVATTGIVAFVAHATITNLSWAMAFVLGAIVAPTDELASAPVLERMNIPRHLIAIVSGESLLNDASSLILYGVAVTAAVTGTFSFGGALVQFVVSTFGGIVLGLVVARLAVFGWRHVKDTQLQGVISFNTPFLAYLIADRLRLSGVLAVVYTGITVNRWTPQVITPAARLQLVGYWETVVFFANAILYLLVGFQLHDLAQAVFAQYSWQTVFWYAFVVNATIIVVRFVWIVGQEYVPGIGASSEHPDGDWRHALIASWSGLRGAVSLAAALAIPTTIAGGAALPHRDLVIFLTFSVILVTLVLGGLTLPLAVRALQVEDDAGEEKVDLRRGQQGMFEAALREVEKIEREGKVPADQLRILRKTYEHKQRHVGPVPDDEVLLFEAQRRVIEAERRALVEMRKRGEIDNVVQRRLVYQLDIAEERLDAHVH